MKKMLPTTNIPDTLTDLCLDVLVCNIKLLGGSDLHNELCESFLCKYTESGHPIDDTFSKIFSDTTRTKLKRVTLKKGIVTERGLCSILKHRLLSLDVTQCRYLPRTLLKNISDNKTPLQELSFCNWPAFDLSHPLPTTLRKLEIIDWEPIGFLNLGTHIHPLKNLVFLNLSKARSEDFRCLESLQHLKYLILYGVPLTNPNSNGLKVIKKLVNLTHLDISSTGDDYKFPDFELNLIVQSLTELEYLDISETNLPGRGVAESPKDDKCDIVGLTFRANRPFQFLGLFDTKYEACRRHDIPAIKIAGDATDDQLVVAAKAYMARPHLLDKILNEIYNICREADERQPKHLLEIIIDAMERHEKRKTIQISGSATLFFIVKAWDNTPLPTKVKQRVIHVLLNGMFAHRDDQFMLRNGCLCLCQFKIPQDVVRICNIEMFEYKRLVDILLFTATEIRDALFIQRIAIYLLNSLACQVDGTHKHILGHAGAVQRMLNLIEGRLKTNLCDDVMEVAWSTLWNVTDETADNCRHFLDGGGMDFFLGCLRAFPLKEELLRNMMGLLGNVAEVAALRPRLMTVPFVTVFSQLLLSDSDGIEVSYNAAGVLAHMCSDGPEAWTIDAPAREHVLGVMVTAMENWDLNAERNINYRSFEPILGLLKVDHTPQCQHWAVWALSNLTKVYPSKYCKLVEAEGGVVLLQSLLEMSPSPKISTLAKMVIENCHRFKDKDYQGAPLDG